MGQHRFDGLLGPPAAHARTGQQHGPAPASLPGAGIYHADTGQLDPFDPALINEHVRHAWYRPYPGGLHPFAGETVPDYQPDTDRYTWAKAPRYGELVVEAGPLAELLTGGDTLIRSLLASEGPNTWLRQFARLRRTGLVSLAFSQSGQSPDLVAPARYFAEGGARTVAFVNDAASPLAAARPT